MYQVYSQEVLYMINFFIKKRKRGGQCLSYIEIMKRFVGLGVLTYKCDDGDDYRSSKIKAFRRIIV